MSNPPEQTKPAPADPKPANPKPANPKPPVPEPELKYIPPEPVPETAGDPAPPQDLFLPGPIKIFEPVTSAPADSILDKIKLEGIPIINVVVREIPIDGGTMSNMVWASGNLFLSAAGLVFALLMCVRILIQKQREKEEPTTNPDSETRNTIQRRLVLIAAVITLGIAGIAMFFITEDMSKLMVLIDRWTVVHLVILLVGMLGYIFAFKRKPAASHAR